MRATERITGLVVVAGCMAGGGRLAAAPPRPDHVVIVVEENHSFESVIGSSSAPYMNQLAQQGALLTSMYALAHPSQPNYLEFYSGSNQGVFDNTEQVNIPWSTPNLGAALLGAGVSFVGYAEDLPEAGSLVWTSGSYARRHVPWTNWQSGGAVPGPNQVSASVNQPFTSFPSDYGMLPSVSIVVPNNANNMHDGTIAQADAWLLANIDGYARWAMTHNSLLVVVWDEDESTHRNRIPCILVGPMVRTGAFDGVYTLHDLHRSIADMFSAPAAGQAANVSGLRGMWATDPVVRTVNFRQGVDGYTGAVDTFLEQGSPDAAHGADVRLVADGSPLSQGLVRFDGIFGSGAGRVPPGGMIVSARLLQFTDSVSGNVSANSMRAHRMLAPWSDGSTWNTLSGGVSTNGVECAAAADFTTTPWLADAWSIFDVTASVRAWAEAPNANDANMGWAIVPAGTDGWRPSTSDAAATDDRPMLRVTYEVPACAADFDDSGAINVQDIFGFLAAWFAGEPRADFDGTGGNTVADIFAFLAAWFAGC